MYPESNMKKHQETIENAYQTLEIIRSNGNAMPAYDSWMAGLILAVYRAQSELNETAWVKFRRWCREHEINRILREDPFLERAFDKPRGYPGDPVMLNNLIYTLAASPTRSREALEHLPRLATIAMGNPDFMDTVAFVYIRTGRYREATIAVNDILKIVEKGKPHWFRARIYSAEIALRQDNPARARALIDDALEQSRGIGDADILHANRLLREATAKEEEGK